MLALHLLGARAQALDLAVGDAVVDREHVARAVDQSRRAAPIACASSSRAWRVSQQLVQVLLLRHRHVQRRELACVERQLRDLGGELLEAARARGA